MAHDWAITTPAIGNKADGIIVVTCSACGETGTFAATPDRLTGRRIDLDGVCSAKSGRPGSNRGRPAAGDN